MKNLKKFKLCCKIDYWITEAMCIMIPWVVMPITAAVLLGMIFIHNFIHSKLIIISIWVLVGLIAVLMVAAIACGIINRIGRIYYRLYIKSQEREKIY